MMPYLVDGHNLIPKVSGLSLQAVNDEQQLIELLLEFCRRCRKKTEVFFDNSPSGQPRSQNLELGLVIARFVRQGQSADDAIRARLARLGKNARNWTVVSSDLAVQASARAAHAHFVSSESFAQKIEEDRIAAPPNLEKQPDAALTSQEIDDWLDFFGADGQNDSNS